MSADDQTGVESGDDEPTRTSARPERPRRQPIPMSRAVDAVRQASGTAAGPTDPRWNTFDLPIDQPDRKSSSGRKLIRNTLALLMLSGLAIGVGAVVGGLASLPGSRTMTTGQTEQAASEVEGSDDTDDGADDDSSSGRIRPDPAGGISTGPAQNPVQCRLDLTATRLNTVSTECDDGSLRLNGDTAGWHRNVSSVFVSDGAVAEITFESLPDGTFDEQDVLELTPGNHELDPGDSGQGILTITATFTEAGQHIHLTGEERQVGIFFRKR